MIDSVDLSVVEQSYIIPELDQFVALVPTIQESELNVTINIFLSLGLIIIIMIATKIIVRYSKIPKHEWATLNIYSIILGNSPNIRYQHFKSKIMYLTLSIAMILFSSIIYSSLTNLEYTVKNVPIIKSFENILEKNVSICVEDDRYDFLYIHFKYVNDNKYKKILESQRLKNCNFYVFINNTQSPSVYINRRDSMKILFKIYENLIKSKSLIKEFQIIDLQLPLIILIYIFHPMSLYKEKFSKIATRTLEAGLDKKWISDLEFKVGKYKDRFIEESQSYGNEEDATLLLLLIVLIVGFVSGIIALVSEILYFKLKNSKPKVI